MEFVGIFGFGVFFSYCFFAGLVCWFFKRIYFPLEAELDKDMFWEKTSLEELHGELIWGSELITLFAILCLFRSWVIYAWPCFEHQSAYIALELTERNSQVRPEGLGFLANPVGIPLHHSHGPEEGELNL